jgi:uncharacterized protein YbjT (DUF2867 family)
MTARPTAVLVTGATGYVGGRLVPRLLERGHQVRVMVRDPSRLAGRPWLDRVEVVVGDVLAPATLGPALAGIDVAYYMIHSLGGGSDFRDRDRVAAAAFGAACRDEDVSRIIYLGGLGEPGADLSDHLRSRQETGAALGEAGIPVTELRAAIVVGSGSLSFELIRHLTERLPAMICPKWVYTRTQPIGIRNVLEYLVAALDEPRSAGRVVEIGGSDVVTYADMMLQYAKVRGLRRFLIPVPVLTPRLSSYWVHWTTSVSARVARPLIDGLRNDTVVHDPAPARELFPAIRPMSYVEAVELALRRLNEGHIESSWSDSLHSSLGDEKPVVLTQHEGFLIERRQVHVAAPPEAVFRSYTALGGDRGWLYMNWAWRIRGMLDRLVGGVGFRRGRRDPDVLRVGDALDFWRVEALEPGRLMRLRAEMRLPGVAWLEYKSEPDDGGGTRMTQTAFFGPHGLSGLLYWYSIYPFHGLIFSNLARRVGERARRMEAGAAS